MTHYRTNRAIADAVEAARVVEHQRQDQRQRMIETACEEVATALDEFATAIHPVAWQIQREHDDTGHALSANELHIAATTPLVLLIGTPGVRWRIVETFVLKTSGEHCGWCLLLDASTFDTFYEMLVAVVSRPRFGLDLAEAGTFETTCVQPPAAQKELDRVLRRGWRTVVVFTGLVSLIVMMAVLTRGCVV